MLSSVGLSIFTVSDGHFGTKNLNTPTSRTSNFKTERAVKMKLASLVVLLVVYQKLQTDLEWPVPAPRYSWPNITFHAYLPSLAPYMKYMMTLTFCTNI